MKMVKKILLGLALAGTVLALAGCSMGDDKQMEKEGNKWDFTAKIDHVNNKKDDPYTTDLRYRRAWTQLGNKESVTKIKTTITFYTDKVQAKAKRASNEDTVAAIQKFYKNDATLKNLTANPAAGDANEFFTLDASGNTTGNAVVGFLFDLHKTKNDKNETVFDFVLLGIQAATGKYYVERYTDVPENAMKNPTSLGSLWAGVNASNCKFLDGKNDGTYSSTSYYCDTALALTEKTDDEGNKYKTLEVEVTQETAGTYVLKFGGKHINYTRPHTDKDKKDNVLCGGAGVYSNAPIGTIAHINSHVDKDNTEGLYEEVEE